MSMNCKYCGEIIMEDDEVACGACNRLSPPTEAELVGLARACLIAADTDHVVREWVGAYRALADAAYRLVRKMNRSKVRGDIPHSEQARGKGEGHGNPG
jgi:hypothetical protein